MKREYWSLSSSDARMLSWYNNESRLLENPIGYNLHSELYNSMILENRIYNTNIEILNCYVTKTKPTNLVVYPLIYRYGVDEQLKYLLANQLLMKHKLIRTQYVYRKQIFSDLYLVYWMDSIYNYINFKLCEVFFRPRAGQPNQSSRVINISNYSQVMEARKNGFLSFNRIVFMEDAPAFDWFYIDGIYETNIVSSELKDAIESKGFSGIRFTPSKIQWE